VDNIQTFATALSLDQDKLWAKTVNGNPGISVRGHCLNVGWTASNLARLMPLEVQDLLPKGFATLTALHDVGKISMGFLVKCPAWLEEHGLTKTAERERWAINAESDHAKVGQFFLQKILASSGARKWAVAAGVHHGRIFGLNLTDGNLKRIAARDKWEEEKRHELTAELSKIFGPLPERPPREDLVDLWLLAGLITVADWIGSNEDYFPADRALSSEESSQSAQGALGQLDWGGGAMTDKDFSGLFENYRPSELQVQVHDLCVRGGLIIVEAPMGCGKTEAALWAAHRLILSGRNQGLFFALPTQTTSNRIFQRVRPFLIAALKDTANFRLAHGASWLQEDSSVRLRPAVTDEANAIDYVATGRSWFTSAKHALLARYGVGTVDQALLGVTAVKHFFVRRFALAGKVVILDEIHSYDIYTGRLIKELIRELLALRCTVIVLSATLTRARRAELLAQAGAVPDSAKSDAYPLITVAHPGEGVTEVAPPVAASRIVYLKAASFSEIDIMEECVKRAEQGQHVLYLRNTVVEAQAAFRACQAEMRSGHAVVGLLHGRFPHFRRQELEAFWLQRLGKQRETGGAGSLLIATQVVEQSVDIDLDFIVSDLAPTDMLLQRMGRLWRHDRAERPASRPEFWINLPRGLESNDARQLREALGKSGRVYAPYVLLRTAEVWATRTQIELPAEIRTVLEVTYVPRHNDVPAWQELAEELEARRQQLSQLARASTEIFTRPPKEDDENILTRHTEAPILPVVLLQSCVFLGREVWRVTGLDGECREISGYEWSLAAAKLVARNQVRAPIYSVPRQEPPGWLALHTQGPVGFAVVMPDGTCNFPDAQEDRLVSYDAMMGLQAGTMADQRRQAIGRKSEEEDDDEFDA
jgi:CRISPR-associated endonuclease/helicase Cas3